MERVLSDEEKFRKAEEIYNRRRNLNVTVPTKNLNRNTEKKDYKIFRKMLFQIGICVCIYFLVYFIHYSNYYFSSDVMKKIEGILSYDINFNEKFSQFNEYMKNNNFFSGIFSFGAKSDEDVSLDMESNNEVNFEEQNVIENLEQNNEISGEANNNHNNIENTQEDFQEIEEDLSKIEPTMQEGSLTEKNENLAVEVKEAESNEKSSNQDNELGTGGGQNENIDSDDEQMRKDAKIIKENFQITLPLRGTITSRFGEREIEPKFHTGIDIARNKGSEIISATNGTVILAEEQLSYGKVIKIQNSNLVVLYAHCNELLVKVGDKVKMMQKIATVGSTGNSTGPHLHFEIMYCGRYVNPEYVIEFKE